jgi:formylglycine-generating enzyme required for sulfatase activity
VSFRRYSAAWLAFLGLLVSGVAPGATRFAVVIGNASYDNRPLPNPVHDAELLRDTLKADGFEVTYLPNADRGQMVRAIQTLGHQLAAGGTETVGLFYFSGHGVQFEGHNFLLPVRAGISSDADLLPEAVDAEWVLKQMELARNGLNILILDACRDNPLPARSRDALKGLASMQAPVGSVVAFATDAGSVATDGSGHNSPYAAALARYMREPGMELKAMFDAVAHSVYDATKSTRAPQTPVQTYKLTPTFYFRDGAQVQPAQASAPAFDPRAAELALWQSVQDLGADGLKEYLSKYPAGMFSNAARIRIAALARPASASSPGQASSAAASSSARPGSAAVTAVPRASYRDCSGCPEMVHLPGGHFLMGSPVGETRREDAEGPQHAVQLPAFSLGKYAVTFAEWDACAAEGGCKTHPGDEGWGRGNRPVINVSWQDARQYTSWLSRKTGQRYRLPSEAEWEYAARAGATTPYYWGDEIGHGQANCSGCGSQWDDQQTAPVGSFAPNSWGLYDMLGNVTQWTQDCWNASYDKAPTDGRAWETGDCESRVTRGCSWAGPGAQWLRAAARDKYAIGATFRAEGFRVARTD